VDGECQALFSGWSQVDTNGDFVPDANCDATHACGIGTSDCVDIGLGDNTGRCAADKTTDRQGDCTVGGVINQVEVNVQDINGNNVTVCAQPGADDATCDAGVCNNPCTVDGDCAAGQLCRVDDGVCVQCLADGDCTGDLTVCVDQTFCGCSDDSECANSASGTFCILADNVCGCASNDECTDSPVGDICTDGFCGCTSADTDCNGTPTFAGTTYVCE